MQETVSLYLDLEQGQKADLEVVSRVAIALSEAIREVAYVLDPSIEIRIEFVSGTEGSLSLNNVLRTIADKATDPETLRTIVVVVVLWFAKEGASYGFQKGMDLVVGSAPITQKLSEDDIAKIADRVKFVIDGGVAKQQVEQVYRELERDTAIKGVGATPLPSKRPDSIVPREEFSTRSGDINGSVEVLPDRRERVSEEVLTLISPVLLPGSRRWRFSSREGEFGAPIQDQEFLDNLLSGTIALPMTAGIQITAELKTVEEFRDQVWHPTERSVSKVVSVKAAPGQSSLPLPASRPKNDPGKK